MPWLETGAAEQKRDAAAGTGAGGGFETEFWYSCCWTAAAGMNPDGDEAWLVDACVAIGVNKRLQVAALESHSAMLDDDATFSFKYEAGPAAAPSACASSDSSKLKSWLSFRGDGWRHACLALRALRGVSRRDMTGDAAALESAQRWKASVASHLAPEDSDLF